jgi:hypothetical protein
MILLEADHLMLLLNRLGDAVRVHAPLLNLDLFRLDLSARLARVLNPVTGAGYTHAVDRVRQRIDEVDLRDVDADSASELREAARAELPGFQRLTEAFRQAGVVLPENLDEIRSLCRQAKASNPARGGDVFYFAFDNNALRNRLYSQFFHPRSPRDPHFNFVLARQVRNELECREGKFRRESLRVLHDALTGFHLSSVCENQNRLADRLRLLGAAEWNRLLASGDTEVAKTGEEKPGAPADSDTIIIRTYARFADAPGRKVVLFSSDNEFVLQSGGRTNLLGQAVRYAPAWDDVPGASWESVCRLLYQLAVAFGRLDLRLNEVDKLHLYGVWREKEAGDWEHERVRVTIDAGSSAAVREIERTIRRSQTVLKAVTDQVR